MSIAFSLFECKMNSDSPFWSARVAPTGSLGLRDLAAEIASRGSTMSEAAVLAVLRNACEAIEENLLKGFRINLDGLVEICTSISGKFDGPNDGFDPSRNAVELCASAGARARKLIRENATVEKQDTPARLPNPMNLTDNSSGTTNGEITPGGIASVTGSLLQCDHSQPDEGIYLVCDDGTEYKVTNVAINMPKKLTFLVPPLDEGTYALEVRARMNKTEGVKTGTLPYTLTVASTGAKPSNGKGKSQREGVLTKA